jgi:hypothetical protein
MRKKIIVIALMFFSIFAITVFFTLEELSSKQEIEQNIDDSVNYVSIASYQNGKPLLDYSTMEVDDNSKSSFVIKLENGVDHSRDYKVMVLQNFLQTDFEVDNQKSEAKTYSFNVASRSEVSLPISFNVKNDTKEISVIIVKEPDDIVDELDIDKLAYYEEVFVKRYVVDGEIDIPDIVYNKPDFEYQSEVDNTPIFLSRLKKERQILPYVEEGSKSYLHIGNSLKEEKNIQYAVIALQDWKQVSFKSDIVLYIDAPSNKTIGYNIDIPYTKSDVENLQFIAFPNPFEPGNEKYFNQAEYTFRTAIIAH